jgi:hypothetical protein
MYESLLRGNWQMHHIPSFIFSNPRLYRQHEPESPEIVDGFGNHERALRGSEGEFVGVAPESLPAHRHLFCS